jgi:tubulin---tyrosine ligase
VNDDGPISASSPYIYPFVTALHAAGHQTSVVLPNIPRSWIGKAHIVGSTLECSGYTPAPGEDEWVLVTGTPASCTQLGLYHLFQDAPPPDLVISGPNFGRNATTIYNLSSGTVGGALEAALCQKKAVALSFASKDKQSPAVIAAAARHSVKLIESLYHNWGSGVELYNINVPMIPDVEDHGILYTQALRSSWSTGSLYQELDMIGQRNGVSQQTPAIRGQGNGLPQDDQAIKGHTAGVIEEGSIVNGEGKGTLVDVPGPNPLSSGHGSPRRRYFKWAPQLSDIARSVDKSPPGTDAWAIKNGYTRYGWVRAYRGMNKSQSDSY